MDITFFRFGKLYVSLYISVSNQDAGFSLNDIQRHLNMFSVLNRHARPRYALRMHFRKSWAHCQNCRARKQGDCKRRGQVSFIERRDASSVQTGWKILADESPEIKRVCSYSGGHGVIGGSESHGMQLASRIDIYWLLRTSVVMAWIQGSQVRSYFTRDDCSNKRCNLEPNQTKVRWMGSMKDLSSIVVSVVYLTSSR